MYRGRKFQAGFLLDDGKDPMHLTALWYPWIRDTVDMMDGDGAFRHWKWPGPLSEQPAADLEIYRIIRGEWVRLKNQEIERSYGKKH